MSLPLEASQFDQVLPRFLYRPVEHLRALDPSAMLVSGIRGAGKSFWWHALQDKDLRTIALSSGAEKLTTSAGFGEGDAPDRPGKDVLSALLKEGHAPRLIWKSIVFWHARRAATLPLEDLGRWSERVAWVTADAERTATLLRAADDALSEAGRTHVVLFDALDRTADASDVRIALLRGLLELVVELRPRAAIRSKVFARPDMLVSPEVGAFPDASKVLSTQVALAWPVTDLYGLLFQYLGNALDDGAAGAFRKLSGGRWGKRRPVGWDLPAVLRTDEREQADLFTKLAGPHMGTNRRRGRTYPWLPNHISDAGGTVSPRSFLAAMREAALRTKGDAPHALHWTAIQDGVRKASQVRTTEIQEDLPWASRAFEKLRHQVVPCEREDVLGRWEGGVENREPEAVLSELVSAGMLAELPDGRINAPDLYRVGFGLRRKGGLAPE